MSYPNKFSLLLQAVFTAGRKDKQNSLQDPRDFLPGNPRPLNMTNIPPNKEHGLQDIDDGDSISSTHSARKRDKVREFLGFHHSKKKDPKDTVHHQLPKAGLVAQATGLPLVASQITEPPIVLSQPKNVHSDDRKATPSGTSVENPLSTVFPENLLDSGVKTDLPVLLDRIEKIKQLVYCNTLLVQASTLTTAADDGKVATNTTAIALRMRPTLTEKELKWLAEMDKNPTKKAHIRWLALRIVEEFIQDSNKDSVKIAEVVALAPVLDHEPYRKLLISFIREFNDAPILETDLLQGLVQVVQSASPGFLESDDLVKILSVLRIHLKGTHQASLRYSFHLTLAVSRLLDVMAEYKVKDVDREKEHEPLLEVLSELKGSSDPYLMYQACYACQALQYIPDDETALQAALRHSIGLVDGVVKVSAVFKLDLGSVLQGLGKLHETLGGVIETVRTVYEGFCTVMESGQGVLDSLKEGFGTGRKRAWYVAIRTAYALVEAGQLKDFKRLIYEAPCRRDPLFQWGICQLLGEIASGAIWDNTTVRPQAVDFLGELYKNDPHWSQDDGVKAWMLSVIDQLGLVDEEAVRTRAHILLKEIAPNQDTTIASTYPLRSRVPLPESSPILACVQKIPFVEYSLFQLKVQRQQQSHQAVYIPPQAKASPNAKDDDLFPLMERVQEFLDSERQVMLIMGDSGAGKSTFNRYLENLLWTDYKQDRPVPLFINLPAIREPNDDLVAKQLKDYNFEDDQIKELKLHHQLILICDGYDESRQLVNLHHTNKLNQPGQWNTKMIISCRSQFLGSNYRDWFVPQSSDSYAPDQQDLFQEAVIAPFSEEQIKAYVERYVPREPTAWSTEDYMDRLTTIPNLLDLVRNPFLLTLALEVLPKVTEGRKDLSKIEISRAQLYDTFVHNWFGYNMRRLQRNNALPREDRDMLVLLVEADFYSRGIAFSSELAQKIFEKQNGVPVVQYVHLNDKDSWKAKFFAPQPEFRLLRESSPLTRTDNQFRFVHRSILEYFLSRVIYNPDKIDNQECDPQADTGSSAATLIDTDGPLFRRNLLQEPSIIQFLCDRVKSNSDFKQQLRGIIDLSKTDASSATAATNAITILVRAGVHFNGENLQGIKIPGADLSGGQFDSTQFQGADLTGVNLSMSWLRKADLSGARLKDVRFGELPYLEIGRNVSACSYSPDGKTLAVVLSFDDFRIYDTSTWTIVRQGFVPQPKNYDGFTNIAFSPNNQQIVSAGNDGLVQKWDCTSGEEVLLMKGHAKRVWSVVFSPCGKQIASASADGTVRLWNSQTGENVFILEGHTNEVRSVKYSPDGRQLVSGDEDGTVRFWDPESGEPDAVLSPSLGEVHSLAYSPDGRWIASCHRSGNIQLWNTATKEPGPELRGHSSSVRDIAFSLNGQWIASSSWHNTVRLWDASTGAPVSVFAGHTDCLFCVAISPDCLQVASGGWDNKVRLWEVGSTWSGLESQGEGRVINLAYAFDGRTILTHRTYGVVQKWDAGTGASESISFEVPEQEYDAIVVPVPCMAFCLDDSQFATGCINGSICLWNRQTSTAGPVLEGHTSQIRELVYSPCCRWIASVDCNKNLRLWDLHSVDCNKTERLWDLRSSEVDSEHRNWSSTSEESEWAVVFSPSGHQLAVSVGEGTVHLFNLPSAELLTFKLTEHDVKSMDYSPNGRQIVIGDTNGCIHFWDLESDKPSIKLVGDSSRIPCIAYSPCGQWIASGGSTNTVRIWHRQLSGEVESWSKVYIICSFFEPVDHVAWSPVVPMELATGCKDGSVRVWRISHDDGGSVVVKMLWGSNIGTLQVDSLVFDGTIDLSAINQKLLVQRGALDGVVVPSEDGQDVENQ
ncbi:hypothetical protein BGZ72_001515 [Mortierella alpina]|nr:hypothetical protein BGZ72_001515 [Mortierella alpina]